MAASVLLNFAGGVDFAPTDPLLCLVRTGAWLLSYDRLSVGRFPDVGNEEERSGFVRRKVAELRNILEDRCLSSQDQGERIRLIVLLDFKPWAFLRPETSENGIAFDAAFPSLKVDFVKSTIDGLFGNGNPLLPRFDYVFIFVDDTSDLSRSERYRTVAFHGYGFSEKDDWISANDFCLDRERDAALQRMKAPEASSPLDAQTVKKDYKAFLDCQASFLEQIGEYLGRIGKKDRFVQKAKEILSEVKTVSDFQGKQYDEDLKNLVTDFCGLEAKRHLDCTFFILNLNPAYVSQKSRGSIALKSLIQLLCSIDEAQFGTLFRPGGPRDVQKFYDIEDLDDDDILKQQIHEYAQDIASLGSHVAGMRWDSDKEIEYTEFSPPVENAEGSHSAANDWINEQGRMNEESFRRARRVPFFFGTKPGDWKWYRSVMAALGKCLSFEDENERPTVDRLTRVDDAMLNKRKVKTNFGELGTAIERTIPAEIVSTVDYDKYIRERKDTLVKLGERSRALTKEMVKLGVRSRALWMALFACLAVSVCYAFHFYSPTSSGDHPLWISVGILAICLSAILGAVISQIVVRGKIHSVHREIDSLLDLLRKQSKSHLASINSLAKAMNQADALRKTLSEMKSKYNDWNVHNKKVENWYAFTQHISTWLDTMFSDLGDTGLGDDEEPVKLDLKDSILESKPSVTVQIRSRYSDMKPVITITNLRTTVERVTCFVSNFTMKRPK